MPQTNKSILTREFCLNNRILFYPRNPEEAVFIQERLKDFGIGWSNGGPVGQHARECVEKGMVIENGKLYYHPSSTEPGVACTAEQFDKTFVPPERAFLIEQFNKLAQCIEDLTARVEGMERKVGEMHAALFPAVENTKPGLKRPQ